MENKTKALIGLLLVVLVLGSILLFRKSNTPTTTTEFKIGAILPLTGDVASLGENAKNAGLLAYQDLSIDQQNKIKIIFEDDRFDPKNTVSAFNKLADIDKVNIIVCFTSSPCGAVAPLADQKEIPLIAVASNPKIQEGKKFVVRLEINPSEEAKTLLNYLQTKDYKRIASLVAIHDGVQAGYTALKDDSFYSNKEVVMESVKPDEKDFRSIVTKILAQKPDVIFVGLLPGAAGQFAYQAQILGYKGDFIGFNFIEGEETIVAAKGNLNGIVYTNAQEPQGWFVKKYKEAYQKSPGEGSTHFFDVIKLIAGAVKDGKVSNKELAIYLNSIKDFNGALGVFNSTDTHEFTLPVILKTIRDNQFVKYEK